MKRKMIYPLLAGLILVLVYSFASIKPIHKTHTAKPKAKHFTCSCVITGVSGTYTGPYTIALSWTTNGAPYDHFTYGGNFFCPSAPGSCGSATYGTTTTYSPSGTVTLPFCSFCTNNNAYGGINGRVIPICADGTEGTSKVFSFH